MPVSSLLAPSRGSPLVRLSVGVAAALLAVVVWLAASDVLAAHRTSERVAHDFLALVARERTARAAAAVQATFDDALGGVIEGTLGSSYDDIPAAPAHTRADTALACPAGDPASPPWYFRADFRSGSFAASAAADPELAHVRDELVPEMRRHLPPPAGYGVLVRGDRALVYGAKYAAFSAPVAVYGVVTCPAALGALALRHRAPDDSLVRMVATDQRGRVLAQDSGARSRSPLGTAQGAGLTLAAFAPAGAALSTLVVEREAVPLPLLVALIVATLAIGGLAVTQLVGERRIVRAQAELVATMSHELRTPLAQILMYAETLGLDRVRNDEERRAATQVIVHEARRLSTVVDNVVRLARGATDGNDASVTAVAESIQEALRSVQPQSDASTRIVVRVTGAPAVRANGATVRQIVINLMDNALKFGPAGQTVTVAATRTADAVRIVVDDEGSGVPATDRERIWRRYERGHGAAADGTGIGLAVVRELAQRARGRTWVESAPGGGARFIVELPAAELGT